MSMPINDICVQAVVTKYVGPTGSHGSKIRAVASAGKATLPYRQELEGFQAHWPAALKLIRTMNWPEDRWVVGGSPMTVGDGFVFVRDTGHIERSL